MTLALSPSVLAWARAFDAAARHSSFTRAAGELNITQGAVSQQVKRLEEVLGFPLFVRGPQSLELTPEGRKVAPVLSDAFASIREVLSEVKAPGGLVPVTLSCSPSFALRWLNPRLHGLAERAPHIDLRIFGEFHALDRARMQAEGLEAAIRYDAIDYGDLAAETFLDEYLVAVASPAFVARQPRLLDTYDVDGSLLLHDTRPWPGVAEDEEWRSFAALAGVTICEAARGKRFNLSQLAVDAALAGEGIAIGRLALVLEEIHAGHLLVLFGTAMRSAASYKFISARNRPPRISAIALWIAGEARRFTEARDAFLSQTMIGQPG